MFKAIIIDDENLAGDLLNMMIKEHCPELQVEMVCNDLPSGVKAIHQIQPDIVFLDIELPKYSGVEIHDFIPEDQVKFELIFTTAHDHYALNAFKLSAADYVLKPIEPESLKKAVSIASKRIQQKNGVAPSYDRLIVNALNTIEFIDVNEIEYIEGGGAYSTFKMKNKTEIISSKNLKYYENLIVNYPQLVRCHKSYIVNMTSVVKLHKNRNVLELKSGEMVSISTDKIDWFLKKFEN